MLINKKITYFFFHNSINFIQVYDLLKSNILLKFIVFPKKIFETFSIWQLPIPPTKDVTLKDCMDKWMETEKLDDDNRLTCDFCGVKSNAKKSNSIFMSPKILIIQLRLLLVQEMVL